MNLIARWLQSGWVSAAALIVGIACAATHPVFSVETAMARSCTGPEFRQFDFWVGDWDAHDVDKAATVVARTRVDLILDGCVLREDYKDTHGLQGQSFNMYDASRKVWHQSWVTNRGQMVVIEGKMRAGEMVLEGADLTADGKPRRVRGTWKAGEGGVRETAITSVDDGKTWMPWFDMVLRPHQATDASAADDEKTVAALDIQYQAAVKANDAATMDRILADDFVLVTGSGKVYTKTDLLEDTRSEHAVYEHNEDTSQTVRVWGDTAVVTAKLWEKGTNNGKPFDHTLWFSDTYVRTPAGWRYVFGQSSLPLPKTP